MPADDPAAKTMNGPAPTLRRKILIADDAFDSRQLLTRLLGRLADADVHEARDGVAANQEYLITRPQITFLDIEMPERNGLDVLREIRRGDPQSFVVIVSGFGALERVQAAIELGVNGFVVKPYSERRILDVLRKYVAETGDSGLLREA